MLPGPVFQVELITTSRRARYYAIRALYGLALLFVIWQTYDSYFRWGSHEGDYVSIREMSAFGGRVFGSFLIVQSIAVLFLTPALVAGVIADERQRKTLHYLLASRLTSGEIVLGKLLARLLHVGVFVLIGLPIMSLIGLFGGIDPRVVSAAALATLTSAFFLAGVAVLVSTFSRRVRDAVLAVYILELVWLAVPPLVESALRGAWPQIYEWVGPANSWINWSNPIATAIDLDAPGRGGAASPEERVLWMMGLQVGAAVACLSLAVWRLRPSSRTIQESGGRRLAAFLRGRGWRVLPRPACGDDPMLWKERYVARGGGLLRVVSRVVSAFGLAVLWYEAYQFGRPAFEEMARYGYGGMAAMNAQGTFNGFVRFVGTLLFLVYELGVAVSAAGTVTSEREEDTWTSLTTTDLEGAEILGAKMLGAAWRPRLIGGSLVLLILLGAAAGALHPFGAVAALVELAVYTWFFAALGTFLSLHARNTTRAMLLTLILGATVSGGYLVCCIPLQPDTSLILLGCSPAIFATSLLSWHDVWNLLGWESGYHMFGDRVGEVIATGVLGVATYAVAAAGLTVLAFVGFDAAIDRPRLEAVGPAIEGKAGEAPEDLGDTV